MKKLLTIVFLLNVVFANAQTDEEKLTSTLKEFHQALVKKNTVSINQQTDKILSYGHSNGWVETKSDMIKNLETGYINYHNIKEDSLQVTVNGNMAHARFVGDYNVTMNSNTNTFHLIVLEVWVKKGKRWLLFARQAVKAPPIEMSTSVKDGFYQIYENKTTPGIVEMFEKREKKFYLIDSFPAVILERVKDTDIEKNTLSKMNVLNIVLDSLGAEQFKQFTTEMNGSKIAFIIENEIVFAATIFGVIPGGKISIASDRTEDELQKIIAKIKR